MNSTTQCPTVLRPETKAVSYWLVLLLALLLSDHTWAATFSVAPIRLDLDGHTNNGAFTVANRGADDLEVQIRLFEWHQGEDGADSYTESDDLLFFPRLATIAGGENRVVRIGLKDKPNGDVQKSYRLFIEELPQPGSSDTAQVALAVRFAVPVFVKPKQEFVDAEISDLTMDGGALHLRVHNTGNVHFRISRIVAAAEDGPQQETSGWYLLPGASREYVLELPAEACANGGAIKVLVDTDRRQFEAVLESTPSMCGG